MPGRGVSQDDDFAVAFSPDGLYLAMVQTFATGGTGDSAPVQVRRTSDGGLVWRFNTGAEVQPLQTYGTFGPILSLLQFVSKSPGDVTWESWEPSISGRRAVFRYRLAGAPTLTLSGCCYPNG